MSRPSRRTVMRRFGEYVDMANWLADAKAGIDVDPEDPPRHELALMVKHAEQRWRDALNEHTARDEE
jgi:hypothetical protein